MFQPHVARVTGFIDVSGAFRCVRHASAGGGRITPVRQDGDCAGCRSEQELRERSKRRLRLVR